MFQKNRGRDAHIKDRVRKGAGIMGQIWGIGKRKFDRDWGKRIWLFDALVWSVIGYGLEVWGWKEQGKIESIQDRYIRWILGVNWSTPGYIVREESQRDMLKGKAEQRARNFEERQTLEKGERSEIARKCLMESKNREMEEGKISDWERERIEHYEEREMSVKEMRKFKEKGEWREQHMVEREKVLQREERWKRIKESRYNRWYREVKRERIPEYLRTGWGKKRWQGSD